jgi:hypothetical protein
VESGIEAEWKWLSAEWEAEWKLLRAEREAEWESLRAEWADGVGDRG